LGTLLDNPQAKQVIDQHFPGLSDNPLINMVRGMTLSNILAMPQAAQLGLTKESADMMLAEVNKRVR
jgi:hypothetical protein